MMTQLALRLLMMFSLIATTASTRAQEAPLDLTILEWNVEAGGSDVPTILRQLEALQPFDVLCLSEVPVAAANQFTNRWGADASILGTAGGNARLLVAWNPNVVEPVKTEELKQFDGRDFAPGVQPAPLIAQFRHKATGRSLMVIMNHLARGSAQLRKSQALALVSWAKRQSQPIIAVGGYNFDYDFIKHQGNESFDAFLADDTWLWIKPKAWIDTNWADRNRDGQDDYPDSMLDYTFVAGAAKQWPVSSEIIRRDGDFPDSDQTSDHRPIKTVVGVK